MDCVLFLLRCIRKSLNQKNRLVHLFSFCFYRNALNLFSFFIDLAYRSMIQ